MQGDPQAGAAIASMAGNFAWTEEHDKEQAFAEQKARDRMAEASYEDTLLPDEDTDEVQWLGQRKLEKMSIAEAARVQEQMRRELWQGRGLVPTQEDLRGKSVFCDHDEDWQALLSHGYSVNRTDSPLRAHMIVVQNFGKIRPVLKWSAALGGAFLAPSTSLVGAHGGACLKYHAATTSSRIIYVTDAFKAKHPAISELVHDAAQLPGSKWSIVGLAGFLYKKNGAYKNRTECLGLACRKDVDSGALAHAKQVMDGPAFFKTVGNVDFEHSSSGL